MAGDARENTDEQAKDRDRFFVGTGINRFGERLKEAMEKRGITSNVKMGALCDMSDTVIRNYLLGKTYPTLERLAVLAYVLQCSPEWLLTGRLVDPNLKPTEEQILDTSGTASDEFEMIVKRLPETQRSVLLDAIIQYGVTGIISALKGMEAYAEFSLLSESEQQRLLRLHDEIKKGASIASEDHDLTDPTRQRAGRV
ncbi:helix-turn-helix domain-containing protein [Enterobacter vonholyi]